MKKERMTYETNSEFKKMKNKLIKNGYAMVSDCYWNQTFIDKENNQTFLERWV